MGRGGRAQSNRIVDFVQYKSYYQKSGTISKIKERERRMGREEILSHGPAIVRIAITSIHASACSTVRRQKEYG